MSKHLFWRNGVTGDLISDHTIFSPEWPDYWFADCCPKGCDMEYGLLPGTVRSIREYLLTKPGTTYEVTIRNLWGEDIITPDVQVKQQHIVR